MVPDPVLLLYSVSPGEKWMATWAQGKSMVSYPVDGGEPVLVRHCANHAPPEQPALVTLVQRRQVPLSLRDGAPPDVCRSSTHR